MLIHDSVGPKLHTGHRELCVPKLCKSNTYPGDEGQEYIETSTDTTSGRLKSTLPRKLLAQKGSLAEISIFTSWMYRVLTFILHYFWFPWWSFQHSYKKQVRIQKGIPGIYLLAIRNLQTKTSASPKPQCTSKSAGKRRQKKVMTDFYEAYVGPCLFYRRQVVWSCCKF